MSADIKEEVVSYNTHTFGMGMRQKSAALRFFTVFHRLIMEMLA
jgi:hypothetical protein